MGRKIAGSWLSAYLDGEVPPRIRAVIDRARRVNPVVAQELRELQKVSGVLRSLPTAELGSNERDSVSATLSDMESLPASIRELLAAYADGELSPDRMRKVEATLLAEGRYARLMSDLQATRQALRSLPPASPPPGFRDGFAAQLGVEASKASRRPPAGEVVSAFIDEEVRPASKKSVAASIRINRKARKIEKQYRGVGDALRALPRVRAPENLLADVGAKLRREAKQPATPAAARPKVAASVLADRVRWAVTFFAGMAAGVVWFAFGFARVGDGPRAEVGSGERRSGAEVALSPKPAPSAGLHTPPINDNSRRPPVGQIDPDEPWFADDPEPADRGSGPSKPVEKLGETLRPGRVVTLDGARITFVCLDVQQMFGRLTVSLIQQNLPVSPGETVPGNSGNIIRVEVSASPDQMKELLETLRRTEAASHLLTDLKVKRPPAKTASTGRSEIPSPPAPLANVHQKGASPSPEAPPPKRDPAPPAAEAAPSRKPDDPIRIEFLLMGSGEAPPAKKP